MDKLLTYFSNTLPTTNLNLVDKLSQVGIYIVYYKNNLQYNITLNFLFFF